MNDTKKFLEFFLEPALSLNTRLFLSAFKGKQVFTVGIQEDYFKSCKKFITENKDHNIYVCCGLQDSEHPPPDKKHRLKQNQVDYITSVCCDIDVASGSHADSKNLCPDVETAVSFLRLLPCPPTFIVETGHGIHGWWMLSEAYCLTPDEKVEPKTSDIYRLRKRFITDYLTLQVSNFCAGRGIREFRLDAVYNLDRLMRLPGTMNYNGSKHVPCRIAWVDSGKGFHHFEDLWNLVSDVGAFNKDDIIVADKVPEIEIRKDDDLIFDGLSEHVRLLLETEKEDNSLLWQTWAHDRWDAIDQSQSWYDISLLVQFLRAGISEEDAVQAIRVNRAIFDKVHPDKVNREDYYRKTLAQALSMVANSDIDTRQVTEKVAKIATEGSEDDSKPVLPLTQKDTDKQSRLEHIIEKVQQAVGPIEEEPIEFEDCYRFLINNGIPLKEIIQKVSKDGQPLEKYLVFMDGTRVKFSQSLDMLTTNRNGYLRFASLMADVEHPVKGNYDWRDPKWKAFDVNAALSSPELYALRCLLALRRSVIEVVSAEDIYLQYLLQYLLQDADVVSIKQVKNDKKAADLIKQGVVVISHVKLGKSKHTKPEPVIFVDMISFCEYVALQQKNLPPQEIIAKIDFILKERYKIKKSIGQWIIRTGSKKKTRSVFTMRLPLEIFNQIAGIRIHRLSQLAMQDINQAREA